MLTISTGVVRFPEEEDEAEEKAKAEAAGQARPSYIRLNDADDLYGSVHVMPDACNQYDLLLCHHSTN